MSKGPETSTSSSEPWSAVSPYLKEGFSEAANLYNNFDPQFYSGETQAGFSPDQMTAQQGTRDFATQGAPEIMNPALGAYQYGTGSEVLDVANNPYVTGMAQAAADRAYSGLGEQFANIRGGAIQSGGYGGSRQGIAEGTAIAGAADSANQAAAGIYGQAYGQGLGHQLGTLGQTGSLMGAGFQPYQQLASSGAQQRGREQALISDAQARHQYEQGQPYDKLAKYQAGIVGFSPFAQNAGTNTRTTPGATGMNTLSNLFGMYAGIR
jgi:hypothetical protein